MKTLKGWITTGVLTVVLTLNTFANGGIIVGNVTEPTQPCTAENKVDWGIIVGNFTGIIVGNFTGIIVGNITRTERVDCGIIVGN